MARRRLLSTPAIGCCGAELPVSDWDARLPLHRTCSIASEPGGQRAQQLARRPGEIKPSKPVRTVKHNHLPIGATSGLGLGVRRRSTTDLR